MTIPGVTYHPRATWEDPLLPVVHPGVYVPPAHVIEGVDTIVGHYTAADDLIDGDPGEHAHQLPAYLRAIQRDYRRRHGFSIGYSWSIDWLGGVWELRGWEWRPAATGGRKTSPDGKINPAMNRRSFAVLFLVDGSDPLTVEAARSFRRLRHEADRRCKRRLHLGPHSEFDWTGCCGDGIRRQMAAGDLEPEAPQEEWTMRPHDETLYDTRPTRPDPFAERWGDHDGRPIEPGEDVEIPIFANEAIVRVEAIHPHGPGYITLNGSRTAVANYEAGDFVRYGSRYLATPGGRIILTVHGAATHVKVSTEGVG